LADLELKSGLVGKKIGKKKSDVTWLIRRVDPVTWQDPVKNSVATR
jgi:hypothetical protein